MVDLLWETVRLLLHLPQQKRGAQSYSRPGTGQKQTAAMGEDLEVHMVALAEKQLQHQHRFLLGFKSQSCCCITKLRILWELSFSLQECEILGNINGSMTQVWRQRNPRVFENYKTNHRQNILQRYNPAPCPATVSYMVLARRYRSAKNPLLSCNKSNCEFMQQGD